MSDIVTKRIDELPAATGVGDSDLFVVEQSGVAKRIEGSALRSNFSQEVDDALSDTSENPVQNKVVKVSLDCKVDVVSGKGLSTNDYTTTEKNKLAGIQAGAQVNPTAVSAFYNDSRYISYNDETDFVSMILSGNTVTVNKSFMTIYGLFSSQKKVFFTLPLSRTNVAVMEISKVDMATSSIELFTVVENTRYNVTITSTDSGMSGTLTLTNMTPIPSGGTADSSALAAKADKVTEVTVATDGAVTQALEAGKWYHFTGALTSLTVTLTTPASGELAQYHFDFTSGATAPTVTIPNTVTMPDSFSVEANKRYEVDILNNYGAVMAWAIS